ncbi:MAG: hypothetical protein IPO66_08660 [Rhodanobacteraceae bacterium]|nr:hypothetical protein [Rhodanobacteraceae bacterium]
MSVGGLLVVASEFSYKVVRVPVFSVFPVFRVPVFRRCSGVPVFLSGEGFDVS